MLGIVFLLQCMSSLSSNDNVLEAMFGKTSRWKYECFPASHNKAWWLTQNIICDVEARASW
jgi:hypothetical protein